MADLTFDEATERMGGLAPTDAPIPGQSLTEDPEQRSPFERPPQHVDQEEAVRDIFMKLTDEDKVDDVLDTLRQGTPVEDLAQVILFEGFRQGKYTPDLMLMLIEPTIYLVMAIAESAGIDYELYPEEDFWGDDEEDMVQDREANIFSGLMKQKNENATLVETGVEGAEQEVRQTIDEIERPASVTEDMLSRIQQMGSSRQGE